MYIHIHIYVYIHTYIYIYIYIYTAAVPKGDPKRGRGRLNCAIKAKLDYAMAVKVRMLQSSSNVIVKTYPRKGGSQRGIRKP